MNARAAAIVLVASLLPGCFLLGGPCTDFAPRAEAALGGAPDRAAPRDALAAEGWALREDDAGRAVIADLEKDRHTYVARAFPPEMGPGGRAWPQVEGGPLGDAGQEPARAHLEPIVKGLFDRLGAEPAYYGGNRHCGAI